MIRSIILTIIFFIALGSITLAYSAEEESTEAPQEKENTTQNEAQEVDVKNIRKRYWARGDKARIGVVQNRKFTKKNKFELGVFGGFVSSDPFLDNKGVGLRLGYHFSEFIGLNIFGFKDLVTDSAAAIAFAQNTQGKANTNIPNYYVGAEGLFSFLYGKLSLLGAEIIYYDLYFALGGGLRDTETGQSLSGTAGLGQRFFVGSNISIRLDYRIIYFKENIPEKVVPQKAGTLYPRTNVTHPIFLGVDFLF